MFVHAGVRLKGSDESHDVYFADVYIFWSGKAIQMRAFSNRQEALRWDGVEDWNP